MPAVGVAGCGTMGLPMAERLLAAGFEVYGFDVRPPEGFGEFRARMLGTPEEFAQRVDVVFSVVRDAEQTMRLCFDEQRLFELRPRPEILVISSTLSPRDVHEVHKRLPSDVTLVDAPMSGAPYSARAGALTFMIGGHPDVAARLRPYLETMGNAIHHLGPLGTGMTVKVLNNYVAAASVVAVRRVMDAADALGLDVELLRDVMANSSGSTWYGDNFHHIDWSREGYRLSNTIGIIEKDVLSALDTFTQDEGSSEHGLDAAILAGLRALKPRHR